MIFRKLVWAVKRHPLLYKIRFKLLSRSSKIDQLESHFYNLQNPKEDLPRIFHEINFRIFPSGRPENDWETAKQIGYWMYKNIGVGSGLSLSSSEALTKMLNNEGGVCSDKVQVYNNFCVLNDLKVREWGSTRKPFDKTYGGHSFNEVYSKEMGKWLMIDISYGIFFECDNEVLSVLEITNCVRSGVDITSQYIGESCFVKERIKNKIYFHQNSAPFLICNYSNRLYDRLLSLFRPALPVFVIHFLIYLTGKSYFYLFPMLENGE